MMRSSIYFFGAIFLVTSLTQYALADHHGQKNNILTGEEKADGWQLLFDGKSLSLWRNYMLSQLMEQEVNEKWKIEEDTFTLTGKGGGDIITKEQYGAFELKLDFKISPKGNSGIMFHVQET